MNKKLMAITISSVLTIGLTSNSAAELITFDGLAGTYMPGEDFHDSAHYRFIRANEPEATELLTTSLFAVLNASKLKTAINVVDGVILWGCD